MSDEEMYGKYKKYDLLTIKLTEGVIRNCLVYEINERGIKVYPIQKFIEETELPRAIARVFVPNCKILECEKDNINRLFYAVHAQNNFVQEALSYHMQRNKTI